MFPKMLRICLLHSGTSYLARAVCQISIAYACQEGQACEAARQAATMPVPVRRSGDSWQNLIELLYLPPLREDGRDKDAGQGVRKPSECLSRIYLRLPEMTNAPTKSKPHPTGREPAFSQFNTIPAPSSSRRSGHSYPHRAPPSSTPQNFAQHGPAIAAPPRL